MNNDVVPSRAGVSELIRRPFSLSVQIFNGIFPGVFFPPLPLVLFISHCFLYGILAGEKQFGCVPSFVWNRLSLFRHSSCTFPKARLRSIKCACRRCVDYFVPDFLIFSLLGKYEQVIEKIFSGACNENVFNLYLENTRCVIKWNIFFLTN